MLLAVIVIVIIREVINTFFYLINNISITVFYICVIIFELY